jgi:GAF domain-containing protein
LALVQTEKLSAASLRFSQAADLQEITQVAVETLGIPTVNRAILGVFSHNAANELETMTVVANWSNGTGTHPVTSLGTRYQSEALQVFSLVLSPEPVFFSDAFTDARIDPASMTMVKAQNLRSMAVLPLFLGARQLGVLMFESDAPHSFSPAEIRLFTAMAPQIATVLENRRQFELAQRQAEREAMLNAINQKIQGATTVEAVLQIAARELGQALGAPLTIAQLSLKDKK